MKHESALSHGELEFSTVVAFVGAIHGNTHEVGYDLVEAGSEYGVIVCLGQCLVLDTLGVEPVCGNGDECNEQDRGRPETNDCNRLSDSEGNSSGHVEEQRYVGSNCRYEGDGVDGNQPANG